ncbi:MAG: enoyl-CoA hydratase/isomerase family protein, partial [Stellaceae bacterium]
ALSNVIVDTDARGVATVTLNRPEIHNAFDDALIGEMAAAFNALAADAAVRVLVLTGAGKSFSAGADLNWMKRVAGYSHAENLADAMALAQMLRRLNEFPRPTLARVNGSCFAGSTGLIACCDIVIASAEAKFAVNEVRLGLIPATIAPYVLAAIGARQARRLFLTAERLSADEARRIGLVHEVVPREELDAATEKCLAMLLEGATGAQANAKRLITAVANRPVDESLMQLTASGIADARASTEGREGVTAFLQKRKAAWRR